VTALTGIRIVPVSFDKLTGEQMTEVRMSREMTRELRVLTDDAVAPPMIRAMRIERRGHPSLVLPLYPDVEYVFGRSGDSSVVFTDDAVSRQHGRLWCDAQLRWVYRDLSSSNGSFRNPKNRPDAMLELRGSTPVLLSVGDELLLGTERSRIVLLETAPAREGRAVQQPALLSEAARALEARVQIVAQHQLPVVLFGASGTGKTFTARRIHELSGCPGNFILVNCGRLPRDVAALQSELLGHVKGAYTGATGERPGKFFAASNGTLFLDEVESLPREAQDFLIDVLEGTGAFAPLGASADDRPEAPRFRLISAAKTPLRQTTLRPDLVERLLGDPLTMPSLDQRREDIAPLVAQFLATLRTERNIDADVTPEGLAMLQTRSWPGQIRELQRVIEVTTQRLAAERRARGLDTERLTVGLEALVQHLEEQEKVLGAANVEAPPTGQHPVMRKRPADLTHAEVAAAVAAHGGNKTHAAAALGIALNTLKKKLRQD
jgi:DNA-binding NtrC family response regulator